jgi:metal-responsive CopG/Arc/MetJ family transcriptional regulator
MRVHINLEEELVEELDRRAGARGRSAYIASTLRRALEDERRWDQIASAVGSLKAVGHDWDDDPADWVASQRRSDAHRLG